MVVYTNVYNNLDMCLNLDTFNTTDPRNTHRKCTEKTYLCLYIVCIYLVQSWTEKRWTNYGKFPDKVSCRECILKETREMIKPCRGVEERIPVRANHTWWYWGGRQISCGWVDDSKQINLTDLESQAGNNERKLSETEWK